MKLRVFAGAVRRGRWQRCWTQVSCGWKEQLRDLHSSTPLEGPHVATYNKTIVKYNEKLMSLVGRLDDIPCFMSCVRRKQSTDHLVQIDDLLSIDCISLDHESEPVWPTTHRGGGGETHTTAHRGRGWKEPHAPAHRGVAGGANQHRGGGVL